MGQTASSDEKTKGDDYEYVKLAELPFHLPPNMRVSIKFPDGAVKPGKVVQDFNFKGVGGVENIKVEYDDDTTQTFTSSDGETIRVKFDNSYSQRHYRGGIRRKTHKKRKIRRNKKSKSRRR